MAKTSSNVISDFRKWLKGNGSLTPNSANSYITYLGVSYNNDLGLVPTDNVYNYMDVIEQFYQAGDMLYAVTVINNIIERINNLGTPLLKALNDQRSALKKLRVFLHSIKNNVEDRTYLSKNNPNNPTSSTLDDIRNSFPKNSLDKIDGIRSLIDLIDTLGEKTFIKLVIESSYFFDVKIVDAQRKDIFNKLGNQPIPARKTTKKDGEDLGVGINTTHGNVNIFLINNKNIPVLLDKDGNEQVRKLIKRDTGYTISEGSGSIFKNYNISHIWGKAWDPRYFTNLWNIVLVPTWANSLLDKYSDDKDSIEYKLKEMFKKICVELYGINGPNSTFRKEWEDMASRMGELSEEIFPSKTSKDPTYKISVIHEKNDGAGLSYGPSQVGRIILQTI